MLRLFDRLVQSQLRASERALGGASLAYLRDLWRVRPGAFLAFARARPFLGYPGGELPPAAYHVARIAATRAEDCGSCVRITMTLAHEAGVARDIVRAAVLGHEDELPGDLAIVYRFADAVARANTEGAEAERAALLARFGEGGIAALAVAIAGARTFPTLKRALGHATSCESLLAELGA